MIRTVVIFTIAALYSTLTFAQFEDYSFGEGFRFKAKDNTFSIKAAFRFQLLSQSEWDIVHDDMNTISNFQSAFLVRRSRLKFNGFAFSPNLKYKFELGLSNRGINNPDPEYFGGGANIIYDAYVDWNFYGDFSLRAGQGKLPGNRERVISSGNLQLVDRSILNSRFNLDRDIGISLIYNTTLREKFGIKLIGSFSQGEGRNVIAGNRGGFEYTLRTELLPFGQFHDKGDYIGSAIYREESPKLSVGITYDWNKDAGRTRGNLGNFLPENARLESLRTFFADFMFKYSGLSVMGEYAYRETGDGTAFFLDETGVILGNYYTGWALNMQGGWMFKNNIELAGRYAHLSPSNPLLGVEENHYFLALSKFIVGHKLKIQTDIGYIENATLDDELMWRLQFDFHL